jgi:SAM-dependent methyltransferase
MHPNLLAYKDYEVFNSEKDLKAYRKSKLESVKKNVHFIEENFNKKVRVLEIGSGNSKFLYALDNKNLLESGYGVEVSENRVNFADKWKKDLGNNNIYNYQDNILNTNLKYFGSLDLVYCVDLAYQFINPIKPGSDKELMSSIYDCLDPKGKLILELDSHKRLISQMQDGKLKTWQEFKEPDPWKYLLWDCELQGQNININKTFIKRDLSETSVSNVILKNYDRHDIISLMKNTGFRNCKVFEHWEKESDILEDEYIVIGEKYA